ncbi:hypothetical protein [Vibrio methylphosphonaticus]|uniref:hypothetical protein n=1 Tax=Vibrio methylphosphonaticus TaxID=2946866 RepID=UPI00202AA926|nr:hypothetical protein [Vibrio methylphosphonaticus]MCL9775823.1 hypothetical protein [Vibrio methylphosphonaticus]
MNYLYVHDMYDDNYTSPPPLRRLTILDVPQAEIEIRDILLCWYETGFIPLQQSMALKKEFTEHKHLFVRHTRTLCRLIKCKAYFFAVKRVISIWDNRSLECQYLAYLLNKYAHHSPEA